MSVTLVTELVENTSDIGEKQSTYVRVFHVKCSSQNDDAYIILSQAPYAPLALTIGRPNFPLPYASHYDNGSALAISYNCNRLQNDPYNWIVTVTYSNRYEYSDPLAEPADISYSTNPITVPLVLDCSTPPKAVKNSAGDQFNPLPEVQRSGLTLSIGVNIDFATFSGFAPLDWVDSCNSQTFFGGPAETWLLRGLSAQRTFDRDTWFWRVNYQFEFLFSGWRVKPLDQGIHILDSQNVGIPIPNAKDQQLLDGHGHLLAKTAPEVFMDFQGYRLKNFNLLPFASRGYKTF